LWFSFVQHALTVNGIFLGQDHAIVESPSGNAVRLACTPQQEQVVYHSAVDSVYLSLIVT